MSKKNDSMRILDSSEPQWNCQRCGQRMQKWKHAPEWVPPTNKSWFAFWYECLNKGCRTKQVMPKEAYVRPGGDKPQGGAGSGGDDPRRDGSPGPFGYEQLLCAEDIQRLAHFKGI
jgi:hypothetical protein